MPLHSLKSRTNSLAFAKSDCHTCTANQRQCDRKRPRCSACSGKNIICGGYAMPLKWSKSKPAAVTLVEQTDDPFRLEPLSLQASVNVKDRYRQSRPHKPRKFRFVIEQSKGRKKPSTEPGRVSKKQQPVCCSRTRQGSVPIQQINSPGNEEIGQDTPARPSISVLPTAENGIRARSPTLDPEGDVEPDLFGMLSPNQISCNLQDWWLFSPTGLTDYESLDLLNELHDGTLTMALPCINENIAGEHRLIPMFEDPPQNLTPLPNPILHKSLFEKFEALINLYDQVFCVIPLSGDVASNPFRYQVAASIGSKSLLHAILAVACYHTGRQARDHNFAPSDVVNHQNTAVKLYHDELDASAGSPGVQLLDTMMVLFLYNATQCAFSNWAARISEAGKLLQMFGGVKVLVNNYRLQAQVVMLLWWDATIALLSRKGRLIPSVYFETVLVLEDHRYWNFFDLIGCPRELVTPLMQLVSLAEENEKGSSMRWIRFDLSLVDEIQASIISWENPSLIVDDEISEEQMQRRRDRWNCTEAWRYGLLIYIMRVFRWDRKSSPPSRLALYARIVLEHVHSCRRTAIVQKQALLPLFFASCETKDQFSRQSVRDYCQYWGRACGYDLFRSAAALLGDVWREQDELGGNGAWWGSVVDEKQRPYLSDAEPLQFCFG